MSMVGKAAPDFRMASTKNLDTLDEPVALEDYRGRWLVMFFYPEDFTFVCPTEILAFSAKVDEFEAAGASVIGVSTDNVHSHQAWIEFALGKLKYPLACDPTTKVSRSYGVLLEDEGIAQRGAFIIDPAGVVRYEVVHDLDTGRNVEEIYRVLRALQMSGKCPAGWKPGEPMLEIKPLTAGRSN
jgi:peroxiredoxin (alkyl hydroperoxide reductase subunit C)